MVEKEGTAEVTAWAASSEIRHPTILSLLDAPGFLARRMYQTYVGLWTVDVDSVMTGPQFAVLAAMRAYEGLDQRTLAASVAVDTSTMTGIVSRLMQRGLIRRETAPEDGRRRLLYLTQEGVAQFEEVSARARELDIKLMAGYSSEERGRILKELTVLGANWEALAPG